MIASVRAELRRLGRWPTVWALCGTWLALNLAFGYLFRYLTYRSNDGTGFRGGSPASLLLADTMPAHVPIALVQGLPMFGGALLLILGAVSVGSGYGWGTWKTVFTAGPSRMTAFGGTIVAVAVVVAGLIVVTLAVDFAAAFLVAGLENQPAPWPGLVDTLQGLGAGLLIGGMWAAAGVLLGTLTRGPALAVGLGLVWSLVVENLLRGVATLLGPLKVVTDVLPGTAAGSLAGALGGLPQSDPNGTPGVNTILHGTSAVALLVAYLAVFVIVSTRLTLRRDIAS